MASLPVLTMDDMKAPASLVVQLHDAWDPVSQHLRTKFSSDTTALLDSYNGVADPTDQLLEALIRDLNTIIETDDLYERHRFELVPLNRRTIKLLRRSDLSNAEKCRLNRLLLQAAYPETIIPYLSPAIEWSFNLVFYGFVLLLVAGLSFAVKYLGWISFVLFPLGFIGIVLILKLLETLGPISWRYQLPGRRVATGAIGGSEVSSHIRNDVIIASQRPQNSVTMSTEGTYARCISDTEWELHICFSLHSKFGSDHYLFDIHAHEYLDRIQLGAPLTIDRSRIILYQDNSILSGGRTYSFSTDNPLFVDLTFRITRVNVPGYMMYVMGLFLYCHYKEDGEIMQVRLPSDSIYVFQNPETRWGKHFLYITNERLGREIHNGGLSTAQIGTLWGLARLLRAHLDSKPFSDGRP